MTRDEHLAWAKTRALEYLDADDVQNAYASMVSDLGKHPETAGHPHVRQGMLLLMTGPSVAAMREHVDGYR